MKPILFSFLIIFFAQAKATQVSIDEIQIDPVKCFKSLNFDLRNHPSLLSVKAKLISFGKIAPVTSGKTDFEFMMFTPGENGWRAKGTAHVSVSNDGDCRLESIEGQIAP